MILIIFKRKWFTEIDDDKSINIKHQFISVKKFKQVQFYLTFIKNSKVQIFPLL